MARYATTTTVLQRLPQYLRTQLLDDDHDGTEDTGLADSLLDAACDEIDGYLQAAGWQVPITSTVPPMVRQLVHDIFWYRAHDRINAVDDRVQTNWESTLRRLESLQKREVYPGLDPAPAERPSITETHTLTSADRVFGRSNLTGY